MAQRPCCGYDSVVVLVVAYPRIGKGKRRQTTRLGDSGSGSVCQVCLVATTLVHAPRAANTPEASAAPQYSADPSATVEALAAHVELIADLLAALDGNDPLPSKSNWASRLDAPPVLGSITRATPIATLLETLGSGNCGLDDLVRVLAAQLALVRKGDPPYPPDRS